MAVLTRALSRPSPSPSRGTPAWCRAIPARVKPNNLTGVQTIASIDGTTISPFYLQMSSGVFQFTARDSDSVSSTPTTVAGGTATVPRMVLPYGNLTEGSVGLEDGLVGIAEHGEGLMRACSGREIARWEAR